VVERLAGRAHFGSEHLQHLERKLGIGVHQIKKLGAADKTHLSTGSRNRAVERIGLVAKSLQAGQATIRALPEPRR